MALSLIPYIICAAAYGFLLALLLARRSDSRTGRIFLAACFATFVSAVIGASFGRSLTGIVIIAGTLSVTLWLLFICVLPSPLSAQNRSFWRPGALAIAAPAIGILTVCFALADMFSGRDFSPILWQLQLIGRLTMAVLGISVIENFFRNTAPNQRWAVTPLCIGLGSTFAFDLYFFSDALLFRHLSPALMDAGEIVQALAVPLLALSMARNESWRVPIRVSRDAVFHGVTLVTSGIFLLAIAAMGTFVRRYGGDWTIGLQIALLFGSGIVLAVVLSSATAKSYLRNIVLKNFFPYRYDYRIEWMKFTETLSSGADGVDLVQRVIVSIADIVDSPGGVLFLRRDDLYVPAARWNAKISATVREPESSVFIAEFGEKQLNC